ncbi:hypothetical protein CRYUN_Cryun10bG0043500 [Craigia yunnanensis]
MGKNFCDLLRGLKPVILLLVVQAALAGVIVFYKLAVIDGMSMRVLIAYRFIFAAACAIPLAFILERESKAKLTWKVVFQGFLLGLFGGALAPNFFIASLSLTSATFTTAMSNLVPIATFILAVILRMERLGIRTLEGQAKFVGTFLSIGGAMILTFYKGQEINLWSTNINLAKHGGDHVSRKHAVVGNQVLGSLLALANCVSFAIWYIILAKMGENYPFMYSTTALMCITASIQATIYSIIAERNCILGSVMIIIGVYVVLWGKTKEKKTSAQLAALAERSKESEAVDVVIQDTDTNQSCDTGKAISS